MPSASAWSTVDKDGRINGFEEKPKDTKLRSPWNPEKVAGSMGVYLFNADVLIPVLLKDAEDQASSHDFGKDILPKMVDDYRVFAYDFIDENKKEALYWRDVGTLEAYYEANMDIVSVSPIFNLYDHDWPIRTHQRQYPPAKFVFAEKERMGTALDSIVSNGCIVSGGLVRNSILSPDVRVNSYSEVDAVDPVLARRRGTPLPHPPLHHRPQRPPARRHDDRLRHRSRPLALLRHRQRHHRRHARLLALRESSDGRLLHQRVGTGLTG